MAESAASNALLIVPRPRDRVDLLSCIVLPLIPHLARPEPVSSSTGPPAPKLPGPSSPAERRESKSPRRLRPCTSAPVRGLRELLVLTRHDSWRFSQSRSAPRRTPNGSFLTSPPSFGAEAAVHHRVIQRRTNVWSASPYRLQPGDDDEIPFHSHGHGTDTRSVGWHLAVLCEADQPHSECQPQPTSIGLQCRRGQFSDAPEGGGYACGTNCKGGKGTQCYVACDSGGSCVGQTPGRLFANVTLGQFLSGDFIGEVPITPEDRNTQKHNSPPAATICSPSAAGWGSSHRVMTFRTRELATR